MLRCPLDDQALSRGGQTAMENYQAVDSYQCFITAVECVEVGRPVIGEIRSYDNSVV